MPNKKPASADTPPEHVELERRVDAMMSVETPAADTVGTAPQLPPKLLKTIGAVKTTKTKAAKELPADVALRIGDTVEPDEPEPAKPPTPLPADNLLEKSETDKAVDDIVSHEADTQLAVDDAIGRRRSAEAESRQDKPSLLAAFFTSPWTWLFIIGTVSVVYIWYR